MTPERWAEIERVYHAVLEQDAEQRSVFLKDACAGDDDLRQEVESLLHYGNQGGDFVEIPATAGLNAQLSAVARAVRRLDEPPVPGRLVGRSFGPYEVTTLIAAGGMGEVYRAVDRRLERTVAIKILPEHLAADPERRERFGREAKIVSTFSHPHICALYDVGVENGVPYLVMEYVDGETLESRIQRGPLPWSEALDHLRQIADAIDKAHRRGIVHRDLKPANVMLTRAGVKLLDFGLAAWTSPDGRAAVTGLALDGAARLTGEGRIMGTVHYLSPEQLQGRPPDCRSDIFAFGVIAYEMLTGRRTFDGDSQAALISAILKDEPPPITEFVPDVPDALTRTLARCLSKNPEDRWQTANDLTFQLQSMIVVANRPVPTAAASASRWRERAGWTAALVACLAVAAFIWARVPSTGVGRPDNRPSVRFSLVPPAGESFASGFDTPFALSPDGRLLAYVSTTVTGTRNLWLRSLEDEQEHGISGTEGASSPFWSPDSQWVGFFADNTLKKVRISNGLVQIVARNVTTYGGAAWNADDVILFSPARPGGLCRVSARGGPVVSATTPSEGSHFWPQFLRDGEHYLYVTTIPSRLNVGSLRSEPPRELMKFPVRISSVGYVPGYILFVQDATLFARPFDEQRLEFSGEPVRIVDGIPVIGFGRAPFSVSAAGVLAFWPYAVGTPSVLQWFDRAGRASPAVDTPAQYIGFAISPDGRQLALSRAGKEGGADLWLRDLAHGTEQQLTFDAAAFTPQWSPDGTRLAFSGPGEKPPPKLFVKSTGSQGPAVRLTAPGTTAPDFASDWSADGHSIVCVRVDPAHGDDLWVHHPESGVGEPLPFNTRFNESLGRVSPDNHWLTYVTDESGRDEVWVANFPTGQLRRQVSIGGGTSPQWGEGSREIVYVAPDRRLMAASFDTSETAVGTPRALFRIENLAEEDRSLFFATRNDYVATSNGQRFLAAIRVRDPHAPPITIVVNWLRLLNR
jgi:serine/threonine protein kinase/Tol biopolymer transport system component